MTSEILKEIPRCLIERTPQEECIAPDFAELDELAGVDKIEKRVIVIRDGGDIKACAVCNVERRRHHGLQLKVYALFGYRVHDYSRIFCQSHEVMTNLKSVAIADARRQGCDIIIWENIPVELVPEGTLPIHADIKLFTAAECEQGWSRFYKSKHVKYLLNKAKKINGDYHVEIINGFVPDDLMMQLAWLHIDRWRFAGSDSPFRINQNRISEYRVHPSNKHYLRILAGDELIACHYGMRYGDTLLFHTPIINPKFLDLSPMKLILAETAVFCENNGINSIDFGLGDEAYKDGYCTLPRRTCRFEKCLSLKGFVAQHIGENAEKAKSAIQFIVKPLYDFKQTIARKSIVFTIRPKQKIDVDVSDIVTCIDWMSFCDFCNTFEENLYRWQYDRYHKDKTTRYIAVVENGKCKASAWFGSLISVAETYSAKGRLSFPYLYDIKYESQTALSALMAYATALTDTPVNIVGDRQLLRFIESDSRYNISK